MNTIKEILIPFNFMPSSKKALVYALNYINRDEDVNIRALMVLDRKINETLMNDYQEDFQKFLEPHLNPLKKKPSLHFDYGDLTERILDNQKKWQVDLVIMGTRGDMDYGAVLATRTSHLVLEADCPVLSIPLICHRDDQKPQKIALVLGHEEIEDKKLLLTLLEVVRHFNAKLYVLTVYPDQIFHDAEERQIDAKNESTLEYYLEHFYEAHTYKKSTDLEEEIQRYIKEHDIDILSILPRNHLHRGKASKGKLTALLTIHSRIPVLALD
jgi:nucleotide-binding universal stress UspA family protein